MNKWFENHGADNDVAVSTRIRLARNLKGIPFPDIMNPEQGRGVLTKAQEAVKRSALGQGFKTIELGEEDSVYAVSLMEKRLISPEFAAKKGVHGLILSEDEGVCIMVNEEDHLRLQVLGAGNCLSDCLSTAEKIDSLLDESLEFAFDEDLGYLTRCPTNLGTGLRASVMLHLPALTEKGATKGIFQALGKLGFAVRGIYGEGSSAKGAFYQISNQVTLGFTERELTERMGEAIYRVISEERQVRRQIREAFALKLKDSVGKALAILGSSWLMTSDEAVSLLSEVRLGAAEGIIKDITIEEIDGVFSKVQPGNIALLGKTENRDSLRADLLRDIFGGFRLT